MLKDETTKKIDIIDWYISNFELFETGLNGDTDIPFHQTRRLAIQRFAELGFPTTRDEEWRFTNLSPLLKQRFPIISPPAKIRPEQVRKFLFENLTENVLVYVNGTFFPNLSQLPSANGRIVVKSLKEVLKDAPELVQNYLGKLAPYDADSFIALNTAFATEGTVVLVEQAAIVEEPIHILSISDAREESFSAHPRNLIVLGEGSQVTLVESFHCLGDSAYFTNVVSEIHVGEEAHLQYIKLQDESPRAFHIANVRVLQEQKSTYSSVTIDLGGELVRTNLNVLLDGSFCETNLYGFYLGNDRQLIDNHTFIDHARPHCNSNERYKGILDDHSQGVFSGKIMVRPGAQKTSAFQENKTLLLTNDAQINAKPQLEIYADDVKCTHGATIGQIDKEALFYLRARGIDLQEANAMLRHAFASDVLGHIMLEQVREQINQVVFSRFKRVSRT